MDESSIGGGSRDLLRRWREQLARRLLGVLLVVAAMLMLLFGRAMSPAAVLIGVAILLVLAGLSLWRSAPQILRTAFILLAFAYSGTVALLSGDNPAAAVLYFMSGVMLCTLLAGWRLAIVYIGSSGAILGLGAWALANQVQLLPITASLAPTTMLVSNALTFVAVGAMIVVSLAFMLEHLREALSDQIRKSVSLEQANARLHAEQVERMQLERALATSQRLEALGRFAGSVAHDFNNLLVGMRGNVELGAELSEDPELDEMLATTLELVDRASALTGNLLRFSRGEALDAEGLDVHRLLRTSERIYTSVVGNGVELEFVLQAKRAVVDFNPSQFEQILLNLIVNASDAMPKGGRLSVATRNALRDAVEMLEITVTDEGEGMSETVMDMIFQPFFTTKRMGTGIGLATVRDIVTKRGGDISVESELGRGTTFRLSFPLEDAA